MATNLAIDPDMLERALEVSGERTKKAAVTRALQEFIARREQARILGLVGTVDALIAHLAVAGGHTAHYGQRLRAASSHIGLQLWRVP